MISLDYVIFLVGLLQKLKKRAPIILSSQTLLEKNIKQCADVKIAKGR